jgi:OmpA-OmpF porin, OOP family
MIRSLTTIILFIPAMLVAQELILNPGFEQKNGCPEQQGQITLANFWVSPNIGTPDYFNDCSYSIDYGTEFNRKGGQVAHIGHAYAGLQFYNLNNNEFFEYIQTALETALIPGQLYCIKTFVSLGKADYAFRAFGIVLSVNPLKSQDAHKLRLPCTLLQNGKYLTDQDQWMCISGLYRAKGNERLLTFGDFSPGVEFWNIHTGAFTDSLFKSTYYFVDDISMETVKDSSECNCIMERLK